MYTTIPTAALLHFKFQQGPRWGWAEGGEGDGGEKESQPQASSGLPWNVTLHIARAHILYCVQCCNCTMVVLKKLISCTVASLQLAVQILDQ